MERGFKTRCENISLQIRRELGLKNTDPLSPKSLADHIGVYLWIPHNIKGLSSTSLNQLRKDRNSWSALTISFSGINAVIYNPAHTKGRQSSDIMHELSHILLKHKPVEMLLFSKDLQIILRDYNPDLETEADWLAGCLLLPREALILIKRNDISDIEACDIYSVSQTLLTYRTNMTGINKQLAYIKR